MYCYIELKCNQKFNAVQVFMGVLWSSIQLFASFYRLVLGVGRMLMWFRLSKEGVCLFAGSLWSFRSKLPQKNSFLSLTRIIYGFSLLR